MSKPITIPIKKHTRVRRPQSRWQLFVWEIDSEIGVVRTVFDLPPLVVQDISKGLENPLYCISIADQMIEAMNEAINESEDRAWLGIPQKNLEILQRYEYKPSLLTKLKNKLRRK